MMTFASFRPLTLVAAALLAAGSLTSCKKDVVLKTLDVKLTSQVELNVPNTPTTPLTGTWTQELDPNANADVRDNRAKLKKVVVERLAYRVEEYIGAPGTKASGTWKFFVNNAPAQIFELGAVSNVDLKNLDDTDAVQDLTISEEAKTKVVDAINAGQKVTLVFDGGVTAKPAYARFEVQIFTKLDVGI